MNAKQFRLAVGLLAIVVAASAVRHFVPAARNPEANAPLVADTHADDQTSPASSNEKSSSAAEQMAVLGVVGKTFDAMRDQASMTVSSVGVVHSPKALTACLTYASKNGFGGMNRGYAVWHLNEAKVFRFSIDDAGQWNKRCADQTMTDYTWAGRDLLQKMKEKRGL